MPGRYRRGEGLSLLEHDEVKRVADEQELGTLDLAGTIDILWTIKGMGMSRSQIVSAASEPEHREASQP